MMAPRVLISDSLSPAAIAIFKERGVEVDFQPDLGKDKDRLASIIDQYDGLAIRSATKVTAKILENATRLKVVGRAGIGVDNVDIPAATQRGIVVNDKHGLHKLRYRLYRTVYLRPLVVVLVYKNFTNPQRLGRAAAGILGPVTGKDRWRAVSLKRLVTLLFFGEPQPPQVLPAVDRKSTRLNSSHTDISRMPSSA